MLTTNDKVIKALVCNFLQYFLSSNVQKLILLCRGGVKDSCEVRLTAQLGRSTEIFASKRFLTRFYFLTNQKISVNSDSLVSFAAFLFIVI